MLIVQAMMKQYRKPFFERLHQNLHFHGIDLCVVYGNPSPGEASKGDNVEFVGRGGTKIKNYWLFGDRILFQPVFRMISRADLVIVEQANKHLINHYLLVLSFLGLRKVAFWGHGYDRQKPRKGISYRFKRATLDKVDWWFAYTKGISDFLVTLGVDPERITVVNNAMDTRAFEADLAAIGEEEFEIARRTLGIGEKDFVVLYCGALYEEKRISFLLEAGKLLAERIPGFTLLVMGGGPGAGEVRDAVEAYPWIRFLGPRFGREKALYFRMASLLLNPGLLGLAILDAFASGMPVITTDVPFHSPEIEYLESGTNGLMTRHDVEEFASAVETLYHDVDLRERLGREARHAAQIYSLDRMVDNFVGGVVSCLRAGG